ncbi:nucleotidyl transferase AbiEii/AbiGii toxin family protein [candidate division KSB1 bacterium]|nr:nucleotidyl transferase AbiEii/AbiGii toxin family protein [candidate division KSB1 bacterium]
MSPKLVKNIEESTKARLLNYTKKKKGNFNAVLLQFFQERFLARLGESEYKFHFVLKGGFLLLTQNVNPFRPTVDIDMLGINLKNDAESLQSFIQQIACIDLKDSVRFNVDNIQGQVIKEDTDYEGLRYTFEAQLGIIKSKMQLDIAFGDDVPGEFINAQLPTILDDPAFPKILHYPLESVIAEKFQAIVYLGFANSRMKDFYDILFLAKYNVFDNVKIKKALDATFSKRKTDIEKRTFIYSRDYISKKRNLWKAFMRKINSDSYNDFNDVIARLRMFIEYPITNENDVRKWSPEWWTWK